ncbi:DUF2398 family protein [Nocardia higoensis]|uniref:DUF2398 family protein n=1 Tax=Nocardia higoensis TaxID=228599 RepID=A0ABS0DB22_9NOCA|nr:DUF2398 family protein [Nocardia higoensis]MBF6354089.1 DUF2398 family protein [Nocardia higoensis]
MHAQRIDPLELDSYQRAARLVLAHHLVTRDYPDRAALSQIRRWATELREDLAALFGYRLEVTETTARLFPVVDALDPGRPARTVNDRVFDRRRYTYLALALAALGRAGEQVTLSELAEQVVAYTGQIDGLELSPDRAADRDAFVDAVGWLAARGALTLADGDAGGWAADPEAGEALYDIDRAVVFALFRPSRALQHLDSVAGLLGEDTVPAGEDRVVDPAATAREIRRAVVERPVVYTADLTSPQRAVLARDSVTAEVTAFTGLRVERRAEGVALIDTSGRLSDVRFPGAGTLAQVALLLITEIADLVLDIDDPLPRRPLGPDPARDLLAGLDSAIPEATVFAPMIDGTVPADPFDGSGRADRIPDEDGDRGAGPEPGTYPFVGMERLRAIVGVLTERYGSTFAAHWLTDVPGLTAEALDLLRRLRLVHPVADGVLVLPALARYRGAVVSVRARRAEELFVSAADVGASGPEGI